MVSTGGQGRDTGGSCSGLHDCILASSYDNRRNDKATQLDSGLRPERRFSSGLNAGALRRLWWERGAPGRRLPHSGPSLGPDQLPCAGPDPLRLGGRRTGPAGSELAGASFRASRPRARIGEIPFVAKEAKD